jgi:hypothetical protein
LSEPFVGESTSVEWVNRNTREHQQREVNHPAREYHNWLSEPDMSIAPTLGSEPMAEKVPIGKSEPKKRIAP